MDVSTSCTSGTVSVRLLSCKELERSTLPLHWNRGRNDLWPHQPSGSWLLWPPHWCWDCPSSEGSLHLDLAGATPGLIPLLPTSTKWEGQLPVWKAGPEAAHREVGREAGKSDEMVSGGQAGGYWASPLLADSENTATSLHLQTWAPAFC